MIFIGLFLFIVLIVIFLNYHDSSNLEKIEQHLKSQKCISIVYAKGSYKAICNDNILQIENSFSLDIEKNSKQIFLKDIKNIDKKEFEIVFNNQEKLYFKEKNQTDDFYENLQKKLGK